MTTSEEGRRDGAPAGKEAAMSEKLDWLRAWTAPALVVALIVQGLGGVQMINGIGNTAQNAKDGVVDLKAKVQVLESNGVTSTAKMAVVESQLGSMLKMLERIDAKMEARAGKGGG